MINPDKALLLVFYADRSGEVLFILWLFLCNGCRGNPVRSKASSIDALYLISGRQKRV